MAQTCYYPLTLPHAGRVSIAEGDEVATFTGVALSGLPLAGGTIWILPDGAAHYPAGLIADPIDDEYENLELPLVTPWEGDSISSAKFVIAYGAGANDPVKTNAAVARFRSMLQNGAGLVFVDDSYPDETMIPNGSIRWNDTLGLWEQKVAGSWEARDTGGVDDGFLGDITVSDNGATFTVNEKAISYVKMQDVSEENRILIRKTPGAGPMEEGTVADVLDMVSGKAAYKILRVNADGTTYSWATGRRVLTANETIYVRTDGSDSNAGTANNSGGAFATIQKAWNTLVTWDLNGYTVTIQVVDGSYAAGLSASVAPVGGSVIINGNSSTPTNVVISAARPISVDCPATVTVRNMRLTGSTSCVHTSHPAAIVNMGAGISMNGSPGEGHIALRAGTINALNNFTIASGGNTWLWMIGGKFSCGDITITFSGTPAWTTAGIQMDNLSVAILYNVTPSGSATGKRYALSSYSVLNSYGSGTASTYFPGSTNGTVSNAIQQ